MAKNVQNSHFSFARIFILVENIPLRSSPLHEAAERYKQAKKNGYNIKDIRKIEEY
jgi:DNA polymerase IIIc chi subunit